MKYEITIKVNDYDLALIYKTREEIHKQIRKALEEYLPFITLDAEHDIAIMEII